MADHEHSTIKHQDHVLLDQPLLRLPYELLRNNFRAAHFTVEKESTSVKALLKETATASVNGRAPPDHVLKNLDAMIAKMRGVKRKLAAYADEESRLQAQTRARAAHLAELYAMHSYDDVKYETWSRKRLDRLLVDYLLRHGYNESARALTAEKGMDDLVDVQTFTHMSRIQESLRGGSVVDALAWCQDNKKELRKMDSNLEFMLRFQQYIELVRTQSQPRLLEAIAHAKRHLVPYRTTYPDELRKAFGLLAYPPDAAADTYADLYSSERWSTLADLFTSTHNQLLSLPSQPLLHIALSSGLSALKTPACHSSASLSAAAAAAASAASALSFSPADAAHPRTDHLPVYHAADSAAVSPASGDDEEEDEDEDEEGEDDDDDEDESVAESPRHAHREQSSPRAGDGGTRLTPRSRPRGRTRNHAQARPAMVASPAAACPICSTELNELARNVPYAHHTKSHVDPDLLLLPSGDAFGRDRLEDYARKSGLNPAEKVRDLRTGETYPVDELKKVYIT